MKKILALLLSAAMLFCLVAIPVSAEGEVTFTAASVSDVTPGDTVAVAIEIGGADYQANTLVMHVRYNNEYLTVQSVSNGPVWSNLPDDAMKVKDFTTLAGDVAIGIVCPSDPFTGHGTLVTINFVVAENCYTDQTIEVVVEDLSYAPLGGEPAAIEAIGVNGIIDINYVPSEIIVDFKAGSVDEVAPGSSVSVPLYITPNTDYEANILRMHVQYNADALTVSEVAAAAGFFPEDAVTVFDASVSGDVAIGIVCPTNGFTGNGNFGYITFDVAENVTEDQTITIVVDEFAYAPIGGEVENITTTVTNGVIGIAEVVVTPTPTTPPVANDLDEALNVDGGAIHFTTSGDYPWVVVNQDGRSYAQSGNGGHASTTSVLEAVVTSVAGDIIQFEFKAWGEGTSYLWDECSFAIDGSVQFSYGAYDNDWETFFTTLTPGTHTLTWTYSKDSSVDPTGDYFAIDNVYVGEPVHVESIVATEHLEIPVNRTGSIEWTVLPEAAAIKDVTFTSNDPSIATVNSNGVVFGVAEGETYVVITSVDNPNVFAVCEVTVVDTGLTAANIYGIAAYDPSGAVDGQWINFLDADPGTVTGLGSAPNAFAAAYAYGTVYGYDQNGAFFYAPFSNLGNVTTIPGATDLSFISMSYDYTTGIMFGLGVDSNDNINLYAIDIGSGAYEYVAALTAECLNIAIDENGVAYGVAFDGNLYRINLTNGTCTTIGSTGMSVNYVQDMCYDFNTGDLYWAQYYDSGNNGLCRLSKTSGYCEYIGVIGGEIETCGMFIVPNSEPNPPSDIPVTGITINPTQVEMRVGTTAQFTASVSPINASNKNVEWAVDDESIIAIDQNGTVVALAVGTAMVYVTTEDGGYTAYATVNVVPGLGSFLAGYYFETDPEAEGWQFIDQDGDGYNWEWDNGSTGLNAYEGSGLIYSNSYVNYVGALYPDNWAIAPMIILPSETAAVTFYAAGQDPSYAREHFAVYVGNTPNPAQMTQVSAEFVASGEYAEFSADLGAYCGQAVYVAIRHFNVTDEYILNVDQVEFWGSGTIDGAHTLTINYVFEDGTQAAPTYTAQLPEGANYSVNSPAVQGYIPNPDVVTGVMPDTDLTITVVYTVDPNGLIYGHYFETNPLNDGWQFIDDDGDGNNWMWNLASAYNLNVYEGAGIIFSESYINDVGALYPDNWAVSPAITLPTGSASVSLYARGQDASYASEHFAIFVGTTDNVDQMIQVSSEFVATGNYLQYTADLSAFLGQTVYIAIRHFNVTDMFILNVDQFEVFGSNGGTEPTPTPVTPTDVPPTDVPPTDVPPTDVPPTDVPPTDEPVEPTDVPVEPTEVAPTEGEPTEVAPTEVTPTTPPTPVTGTVSLVGLGVIAILSGAGVVLFRKKED